ncbi:MAG: hypothetical protein ABIO94_00570 [Opitutaceae bacterium]
MVKTLEIHGDAVALLETAKLRTRVPYGVLVSKAVKDYLPRVLSGEISLVEPTTQGESPSVRLGKSPTPAAAAGGAK